MAAKSTTFDNDFLKLLFNATPIANIADNAAAAPLTNLYLSLHTASPAVGGNQTTNEAAYTSYARVAVARTAGGLDCHGGLSVSGGDHQLPGGDGWKRNRDLRGSGHVLLGHGQSALVRGDLTINRRFNRRHATTSDFQHRDRKLIDAPGWRRERLECRRGGRRGVHGRVARGQRVHDGRQRRSVVRWRRVLPGRVHGQWLRCIRGGWRFASRIGV